MNTRDARVTLRTDAMGAKPAPTRLLGMLLALAATVALATADAAGPARTGPPTVPNPPTLPTAPAPPMAPAPREPSPTPNPPDVRSPPQAPQPATTGRALPADARVAVVTDAVAAPPTWAGRSRELARQHPGTLELDAQGALALRGQLVAVDPTAEALRRARESGFTIGEEQILDELGLRVVVLHTRPGTGTRAALRRLRRIDPEGSYDYNHVLLGSGADRPAQAVEGNPPPPGVAGGVRVGLIDSGVDASHPALSGVDVVLWGCAGTTQPDAHGTAVASLLAGTHEAGGAGGTLFAADIYCGQPSGGSVVQVAQALSWMSQQDVGVVNISLVGPDNRLLGQAIGRMAGRGHVIVSAVGNDGPHSPPLYPAAYEDVIGVTAVDANGRILPEAVRGPQVRFAAPGTDLLAARPGGAWREVRGTSFAAPLVARLAALHAPGPRPDATRETIERLSALAIRTTGQHAGLELLAFGAPIAPTSNPTED